MVELAKLYFEAQSGQSAAAVLGSVAILAGATIIVRFMKTITILVKGWPPVAPEDED